MSFAVKGLYKIANSGRNLLLLLLVSWFVAALMFSIFEATGLLDSLYWSMTTMSTVGYGDISPATVGGKIFTMAFQAWSIFVVVPNAVAHVIDKIRRDEHKFTNDEQEWQEDSIQSIARSLGVVLPKPPSDTDFKE